MRSDSIFTLEQAACLCLMLIVFAIIVGAPLSYLLRNAAVTCDYSRVGGVDASDGLHRAVGRLVNCYRMNDFLERQELLIVAHGVEIAHNTPAALSSNVTFAFRWIDTDKVEVVIPVTADVEVHTENADKIKIIVKRVEF